MKVLVELYDDTDLFEQQWTVWTNADQKGKDVNSYCALKEQQVTTNNIHAWCRKNKYTIANIKELDKFHQDETNY